MTSSASPTSRDEGRAVKVTVVRASARRCDRREVELADGSTVQDAAAASGIALDGVAGLAVFGERVAPAHVLREGDRVELLGALQADPKDARRARARKGRGA